MRRRERSVGEGIRGKAESGSAIAEMVVVAPLLLLLLIGLIEVGRYGDAAIKVGNAARAGVQYGARSLATAGDFSGMQSAAVADSQNSVTATATSYCECADGTASTCLAGDCAASHRIVFVQVVATGTLSSLLHYQGLPGSLQNVTITNKAVMRVAE